MNKLKFYLSETVFFVSQKAIREYKFNLCLGVLMGYWRPPIALCLGAKWLIEGGEE